MDVQKMSLKNVLRQQLLMLHFQNERLNHMNFHRSLSWLLYYLILLLITWVVEEKNVHFSTARHVNSFLEPVPERQVWISLFFLPSCCSQVVRNTITLACPLQRVPPLKNTPCLTLEGMGNPTLGSQNDVQSHFCSSSGSWSPPLFTPLQ